MLFILCSENIIFMYKTNVYRQEYNFYPSIIYLALNVTETGRTDRNFAVVYMVCAMLVL